MKLESHGVIFLVVFIVLVIVGPFLFVALIPAIPIGLFIVVKVMDVPLPALLIAACVCAAISVAGFVVLVLNWGKLEYGVSGYLIVWGPFIAALCAVALFFAYLRGQGYRGSK